MKLQKIQDTNGSLMKMDLHSIRFFTCLLLREKVRDFSSAFLYVHIHANRQSHTGQKFFEKFLLHSGTSLF